MSLVLSMVNKLRGFQLAGKKRALLGPFLLPFLVQRLFLI